MKTFKEANSARTALKIQLSCFQWTKHLSVESDNDGFCVVVYTSFINNIVKKNVPTVYDGVAIKLAIEH